MNIICSAKGVVDINRPKQGVNDLVTAGFSNIVIDLSVLCTDNDIEYFGEELNDKPFKIPVTQDISLLKEYSENFLVEFCCIFTIYDA